MSRTKLFQRLSLDRQEAIRGLRKDVFAWLPWCVPSELGIVLLVPGHGNCLRRDLAQCNTPEFMMGILGHV